MWLMRHKCVQLSALWILWRIAQVQEELISSWCLKHRRVKKRRQQVTGVILHTWERSWRNGCNRNWVKVSWMVVFRSNQRMSIKGTEQGNPIRSHWLQSCTVGFMMINSLGGRTLAGFRWKLSRKLREGLLRDFRRLRCCCWRTDRWAGRRGGAVWKHQESSHCRITGEMAATVEEEVDIHSSIRGRRPSCTRARVCDERDADS